MKLLEANSVDSIVTDPPWAIEFMSKKWDYQIPSVEIWREAIRVLKPGGHILVCCGTRTQHRMVVNIEDAGFEVRDVVTHLYGSGFPKSHDISKAIDKQAGAEREVVGLAVNSYPDSGRTDMYRKGGGKIFDDGDGLNQNVITAPSTAEAKQWQGWGTALKPACEFWTLARKPLEKGLTIAQNVLKYGTGGLNIDASRIDGGNRPLRIPESHDVKKSLKATKGGSIAAGETTQGRFPANIILDEVAAEMLDEQSGMLKSGAWNGVVNKKTKAKSKGVETERIREDRKADSGGASRFFYVAKASKKDRNTGMPEGEFNNHVTVKPIKLMEYLIKLVTPPNGIVLDPFMGSGTTGVAAKRLGFEFIGVEMNEEYCEIAEKRINNA